MVKTNKFFIDKCTNSNMPKEKSAGVLVFRKSNDRLEYLILHYPHGHWSFPKGHVEGKETEKEAAKREVSEETGIKNLDFLDFKEKISYFFKKNDKTVYKEVVYFLAYTKERKVKISHEHQGYDWLEFKEALERLTFDNAKQVLKKSQEKIKDSCFN